MIAVLRGFVSKEIAQTFRDPRMRVLLFYTPLFQLLVYGLSLSTYTQNVRLAVMARPDDVFMRRLAQRFYASQWFIPVEPGEGDPADWLQSGRAEAVLVAPPGNTDHALGREHAALQLLIDSVNSVRARSIENYAQTILAQTLRDEGHDAKSAPRFRFSIRTFFNPERQTSIYLIPGTLCMVLFLAMTGLTNMSIARERELGTIETLFAAPITRWEFLLGKTLPFMVIGLAQMHLGLLIARLLGVPIRGPLWLIAASTLIFLFAAVFCSFLISLRVSNQQQAVSAAFLYGFPVVQLSGVIFPVENMPKAIAWLAYLNPLHYYVDVMRHLLLKGGDLGAIMPKLAAMAVIGAAAMFVVASSIRDAFD